MSEHVPVIIIVIIIACVKFQCIVEDVTGFKVEVNQKDCEENVSGNVELDKSNIAAPSLWNHEIVESVSTSQHEELDEEGYVEDLFLLWSTEEDKVISVDKSQYGNAQPE